MADDIDLPNLISHLEVNLADTSGIVAEATQQGSSVGAALGQSLQREVSRAVDEIPEVPLTADSTDLDRDVVRVRRELANLAATRIGVDITVEEALRRIGQLEPHLERLERTHPNISVQAGIGAAQIALADITEAARRVDDTDVDIDVNVPTARPLAEMAALSRASSNVGSALRGIGPALGSLGLIAGVAGAGIPVIAGLVATLENIAPAAFIGVSAILALGSAVAAIKIGTSGVGDALAAAFAPATGGGGGGGAAAAAAATNAVADAQRNLRDVTQQAALANAQAARKVGDAERDLRDAQKASLQAQKDLTAAREDAARKLEDLNNDLKNSELAERDAVLAQKDAQKALDDAKVKGTKASAAAIAEAQKALADANAKGSAGTAEQAAAQKALDDLKARGNEQSLEDLAKAQLAADKANQQLAEQRTAVQRLQEDTASANKAGVSGSQEVADAQDKVSSAARDVADRQRDVSDAQADVARTAAQGAEAIDRAVEALKAASQAATGGAGGGAAGGADAFAEAMAKLSPSAQAFVREIIKLKPAFDSLKLDVQERLFSGLAAEVDSTAHSVLPDLRRSLDDSADSLNTMAKGVGAAARDLADDGTLGIALKGAARGLGNLVPIPGMVVTAVGKIGAAASPAFDRLTKAAADGVSRLADRLDKSFSSGGLERAINLAVDTLGDLLDVGGNVAEIVENILEPAHATGGGLIGILDQITGQLAKATSTKGFQDALSALFEVMSEVGKVGGGLLLKALGDLEPVLVHLGPPALRLVDALGAALGPILDALAPLLVTAADGVGALSDAVLPLLPVAGKLVAALGPSLQPILDDLVGVLRDAEPVVEDLASALDVALTPILAQLPALIGPLADLVARNLVVALTAFSEVLVECSPQISELSIDLANLLVATGPLIAAFTVLTTKALVKLAPILIGVLDAAVKVGSYFGGQLTNIINGIVIPAIHALTNLLHGDFGAAFDSAKQAATGAINQIVSVIGGLPLKAYKALAGLASNLGSRAADAANRLTAPVQHGIDTAVEAIGDLPRRAGSAIGDLSHTLIHAGSDLIAGLIRGIRNSIPDLDDVLGAITDSLPFKKGPPERDAKILTPSGQLVMQGFMRGISDQVPALNKLLGDITAQLGGVTSGALALPSAGALAASYAGSAAPMAGPTTINMYGTEATPEGVSAALSWRSKVGRR